MEKMHYSLVHPNISPLIKVRVLWHMHYTEKLKECSEIKRHAGTSFVQVLRNPHSIQFVTPSCGGQVLTRIQIKGGPRWTAGHFLSEDTSPVAFELPLA